MRVLFADIFDAVQSHRAHKIAARWSTATPGVAGSELLPSGDSVSVSDVSDGVHGSDRVQCASAGMHGGATYGVPGAGRGAEQ